MSMIVTSDLIELTKVGLDEIYMNELNSPGTLYQDIFTVEEADTPIIQEMRLAGFGSIPEWNSDGGKITYGQPVSGDRILFTATDFGLAWLVSHKMLRDDLYKKTGKNLVTAAALSSRHTIEQDAMNILNLGFTVAGPDGKYLFANDHPLLGGGTQDNLLADAALTESAIQSAIAQIKKSTNDQGQPVTYNMDFILVPPDLEFTAKKILNVTDRPEAVTNVAGSENVAAAPIQNVYKGVIPRVLTSPYLTATDAYFIGAVKSQRFLKFWWREHPWYDAWKDDETKGIGNSIAFAYAVGYPSYQGIWGVNPT